MVGARGREMSEKLFDLLSEVRKHKPRYSDVVFAPLWDYQRVRPEDVSAPGFSRTFFEYPIGVSCPHGLVSRDNIRMRDETNMYSSSVLPYSDFYCIAIRALIVPGWDMPGAWDETDESDFDTLTRSGVLELQVADRIYGTFAPLAMLPSGFISPLRVRKPTRSELIDTVHPRELLALLKEEMKEYAPKIREIVPVYILARQPFYVKVSYSQALHIERAALMGVILDGYVVKDII
jgi:hypothetical protein